jgi:sulfur-oxidizing protein SoxY
MHRTKPERATGRTRDAGVFRGMTRRRLLGAGAGLGAWLLVGPSRATPEELAARIKDFAGGTLVQAGRILLDIAPIVDNGNSVPVTVNVRSPMTAADHVQAIAIFNESNPQRDVGIFRLGPRSGKASVSTRIRLATSQKLVAVARMSDGTYWSGGVDVVVALAACIE